MITESEQHSLSHTIEDTQQIRNNKSDNVTHLENMRHKDFIEFISNELKEIIKVRQYFSSFIIFKAKCFYFNNYLE